MNSLCRAAGLFGLSLWTCSVASAHPGHGEPGSVHYLTEPEHIVPVIAVTAVVLVAAGGWMRRARGRQQLAKLTIKR